jgi:hypothetical protein
MTTIRLLLSCRQALRSSIAPPSGSHKCPGRSSDVSRSFSSGESAPRSVIRPGTMRSSKRERRKEVPAVAMDTAFPVHPLPDSQPEMLLGWRSRSCRDLPHRRGMKASFPCERSRWRGSNQRLRWRRDIPRADNYSPPKARGSPGPLMSTHHVGTRVCSTTLRIPERMPNKWTEYESPLAP